MNHAMHKMPSGKMMSDKEMKKMMAKPKKMVKVKKVVIKPKKK